MKSTWRVDSVTETMSGTEVTLDRTHWLVVNPHWLDEAGVQEEFLDADPGDEGAEYVETGVRIHLLDVRIKVHPGDHVVMKLKVVK